MFPVTGLRVNANLLCFHGIIGYVCSSKMKASMKAPSVNVGILSGNVISFSFCGEYILVEEGVYLAGEQQASYMDSKILFNGKLYDELSFEPSSPSDSFELREVTIGIGFHWERKEDQRFRGALRLLVSEERIVAVNRVGVEEYLVSVISSEMSSTASKEFLKTHAVISRGWLLAQMEKNRSIMHEQAKYQACFESPDEVVRWYDREDHTLFDVCADDHCQRYQGITRASSPTVEEAVGETRGELIMSGGRICDTRFSKCCGGVTEKFETCWEPVPHTYLTALRDNDTADYPDLSGEEEADRWIRSAPAAFCNTQDKGILSQVLNNYDQETTDFYRWKTEFTQEQLSGLIFRRSGKDFGQILGMVPLKRGSSGRIEKLKITGTKLTYTVGKELEIRRILSESHLYSSAFVVDKEDVRNGIPGRFVLTGAGWGHGVGLCQIGAAVMGAKGYDYRRILSHYFKGTEIVKMY